MAKKSKKWAKSQKKSPNLKKRNAKKGQMRKKWQKNMGRFQKAAKNRQNPKKGQISKN